MAPVGVVYGSILLVLLLVGLRIAGRPVSDTEGLISQRNMLVGVFQGCLGFAVVMSTIYYTARTAEMADTMRASLVADRAGQLDAAVGNLLARH